MSEPSSSTSDNGGAEIQSNASQNTSTVSQSSPHAFKPEENEHSNRRVDSTAPVVQSRRPVTFLHRSEKILISSILVILPMLAFNGTILWLIFGHEVNQEACLSPALCLSESELNRTNKNSDYLVDFPAAKLVFIASWSSTASFTLVGALMSMYGYSTAHRWLQYSKSDDNRTSLPTPYQTSNLLRILNAELMALWLVIKVQIRKIGSQTNRSPRTPFLVRSSVVTFIVALVGCLLIQATDTYLHLATDAIDYVQVLKRPESSYQFSRGLQSDCLTPRRYGLGDNGDFWGCAIAVINETFQVHTEGLDEMNMVSLRLSTNHEIGYATSDDGSHMAIVMPLVQNPLMDWHASSYGVSTQCRMIRNDECEFSGEELVNFNCTEKRAGVSITGRTTRWIHGIHFYDWHQYVEEGPPWSLFEGDLIIPKKEWMDKADNLSEEESKTVFKNPWSSFSFAGMQPLPWIKDSAVVISVGGGGRLVAFFDCESTVFDVEYTKLNGELSILKKRVSNSSTTGIASMTSADTFRHRTNAYDNAVHVMSYVAHNSEEATESYARSLSHVFLASLAGLLEARPAIVVQTRSSKVVSKVPKAAAWSLMAANSLFALYGLGLAIYALRSNLHKETTQGQMRSNVSGVVAQLFEKSFAQRGVEYREQLFEEDQPGGGRIVKRVALDTTVAGGTVFTLTDAWEE